VKTHQVFRHNRVVDGIMTIDAVRIMPLVWMETTSSNRAAWASTLAFATYASIDSNAQNATTTTIRFGSHSCAIADPLKDHPNQLLPIPNRCLPRIEREIERPYAKYLLERVEGRFVRCGEQMLLALDRPRPQVCWVCR
jgi:hypothetical protein